MHPKFSARKTQSRENAEETHQSYSEPHGAISLSPGQLAPSEKRSESCWRFDRELEFCFQAGRVAPWARPLIADAHGAVASQVASPYVDSEVLSTLCREQGQEFIWRKDGLLRVAGSEASVSVRGHIVNVSLLSASALVG